MWLAFQKKEDILRRQYELSDCEHSQLGLGANTIFIVFLCLGTYYGLE